jgi:hypothetical protein
VQGGGVVNRRDIKALASLFSGMVNADPTRDEVRRDIAGQVAKFFAERHANFDVDKFMTAARARKVVKS